MNIKTKYSSLTDIQDLLDKIKESYGFEPDNLELHISFKNNISNFDFYNKHSVREAYIDLDSNENYDFNELVVLTPKDQQRIFDLLNSDINGMPTEKKRILKRIFYSIYAVLYSGCQQDFNEIEYDEILLSILMKRVEEEYRTHRYAETLGSNVCSN